MRFLAQLPQPLQLEGVEFIVHARCAAPARYASGRADVVSFDKDVDESEGARWSVDRTMAWELLRGELVGEISLEQAAKIAERLGEPVPPQIVADSPINMLKFTMAAATGGVPEEVC